MNSRTLIGIAPLALLCGLAAAQDGPKDATAITQQANGAWLSRLPFGDRQDFEDAQRGFVATAPQLTIRNARGTVAWDLSAYAFLDKEQAPPTVNPSLWRQARLNLVNGLFKVTDRVYQVRGYDLSNMDIIEGDTGLIIVDPLISAENAKAALDLYLANRPSKPVVAVIYTHSHIDHYGGVKGVVAEAEVKAGKVRIFAPDGFLEEAISENVYAGTAMGRRALYMYGALLPRGERGQVDAGLGKNVSLGTVTLIPPTDLIKRTGETRRIDGIDFVFQMAPGTEAPAEMLFFLPQFKALCAAEDATHTLHNLYTLRGAQVRDASRWWKALNEAIALFGADTEVVFAQHHWPTWGHDRVIAFLKNQRDLFKYVLDQSLRLMNEGYTPIEIAEAIRLPPGLAGQWYDRDYYGSVNHDAKAVYQRYLGWYDGNPADLYPLPPREAARHYVEFFGGAEAALRKAKDSYAKGEYRWVAEAMKQVVYADPDNKEARALEADALEQLGYQTENPTWRNEFLMGAFELRNGVPKDIGTTTASLDTIAAMTPEMVLDFMGLRLNGPRAEGRTASINWVVPELDASYHIELENSVLIYTEVKPPLPKADVTLILPKLAFVGILGGQVTLEKVQLAGRGKVEGDARVLDDLLGLLDRFDPRFSIVTR
jgi:alkyl sulfatase BDS1-like metallo-beta-lactamase superfamily hydrolase